MINQFSVKTILRTDKPAKEGKYPLNYLVIFNSNNLKLSAKYFLPLSEWDKEANYPKGNGNSILKKKLQQEEAKINDILLNIDLSGKTITRELVKEKYRGTTHKKDFYYYFNEYCKKKFLTIEEGTQYHYLLLRKQLKEYKNELNLDEINRVFVMDFFHYLRTEKGVGESGIATRQKTLSAVLNEFVKEEKITKNPCRDIKKPKENQVDVFLTSEEVNQIRKANLKLGAYSKGLNITRNLFLFSCYTGLRFSDVISLKKGNIVQGKKIVLYTKKTKNKIEIPLTKYAKVILIKCGYKNKKKDELIFKSRTNVSVNRDLKIIAKIAKIEKRLTFHIARHSFGSLLAKENVQPYFIMKLMGHKDIRMTSRYVNSDEETLTKIIKNVKFCTNEKS